ncbi:gluconokinase [Sphingomonas sp. ASY06-1R]|uniref:gluconokinase n=1 Tax=Sphingomonas sp. ASY06-1R TaxID=3445771 RepID=UPI003FA2CB3B
MRRHSERLPAPAIIIMGVSGSGKSTLAALLAERFACPFLEGDTFHSEANVAKMRRGEPLTDDDRWPWLDQLGVAIGAAALAEGRAVAACSALKRVYRDRLCTAIGLPTRFILLEASREELSRRLNTRTGHYMPASLLDSQLALLEAPAADEPALTLEGNLPPAEMLDQAIAWLDADQPMAARRLA